LFWVARYVERAEATLRLARALLNRASESDSAALAVTARIDSLLRAWNAAPPELSKTKSSLAAAAALQGRDRDGSLPWLADAAQSSASAIRDRFSPDAWRALTDLSELLRLPLDAAESSMLERANAALRIIASFSGLAQENTAQLAGWRYLELGRRVERAVSTCRFVRQLAFMTEADGALDALLELADSQITYRLRYVMVAARAPVLDLVVLDPNNPRSIAFQADRIEAHLALLPRREGSRLSPPQQIAASLVTSIRTADAAGINAETLLVAEEALMKLSDMIAAAYFTTHERADAVWDTLP
jgi:uncharacterized alpha-E superfamily protein